MHGNTFIQKESMLFWQVARIAGHKVSFWYIGLWEFWPYLLEQKIKTCNDQLSVVDLEIRVGGGEGDQVAIVSLI